MDVQCGQWSCAGHPEIQYLLENFIMLEKTQFGGTSLFLYEICRKERHFTEQLAGTCYCLLVLWY